MKFIKENIKKISIGKINLVLYGDFDYAYNEKQNKLF